MRTFTFILTILSAALLTTASAHAAQYVYVRSQVASGRMNYLPNADMEWLTDHSELWLYDDATKASTLLYSPGDTAAVCDPAISGDGKWVYFARFNKAVLRNDILPTETLYQPVEGSDICKLELANPANVIQLTRQEIEPLADHTRKLYLGVRSDSMGVLNLGPCPVPGGKVVFTSDREMPGRHQLYRMDEDGSHVEKIGFLNLASALNPTLLSNGRIIFSTKENQGLRQNQQWGIWSINPDGTYWAPEWSAFAPGDALKFASEAIAADGSSQIVTTRYYHRDNAGFGTLHSRPLIGANPEFYLTQAPGIPMLNLFWPVGGTYPAPWAIGTDSGAVVATGKLSRPSLGPKGYFLCSWSPGPANAYATVTNMAKSGGWDGKVFLDAGLYLHPVGKATSGPSDMMKVIDEAGWNEYDGRLVASWVDLYGAEPPVSTVERWTHAMLPKGSPYGIIGTSSVYNRQSAPVVPAYAFTLQGEDAGAFDNSEIEAMRIIVAETDDPNLMSSQTGLQSGINNFEKLRNIGEILLRKTDASGNPILDKQGNPDTSFLARIPADRAFLFQLVNGKGEALTTGATWHQVRPGEVRYDCGGCHAHAVAPLDFETTEAAKSTYQIADLIGARPRVVEYAADVAPIFSKYACASCHDGSVAGNPTIPFGDWAAKSLPRTPATQFVNWFAGYAKPYQSRTSTLMQHLRGENGMSLMPKGGAPLTDTELRTISAWIDTGMARGSLVQTDATVPVVTAIADSGNVLVGVFDEWLKSVSVKLDGVEQVLPAPQNDTYLFASSASEAVVTASDEAGNTIARTITLTPASPGTGPTIAELQQQIADLQAQVMELQAMQADYQKRFDAIKAELP